MTATWQSAGIEQGAATQYGSSYPFRAPVPASIQYLLCDFWLSYPDDQCGYVLPLQVTTLNGFDTTEDLKQIVVSDANGTVVFDTATSVTSIFNAWGRSLMTLFFKNATCALRCTMHTVPPPWAPDTTYAAVIHPNAVLDARAYQRVPRRVRSITVGSRRFTGTPLILSGGYNMGLATAMPASTDGGRKTSAVTLNATPGLGLGQTDACGDAATNVLQISNIKPDANGNLTFDMDGCYRLQRPVTITNTNPRTAALTNPSALQLFNDCAPCCSCQDFVNTYNGVRKLFNTYQALGAQAEAVRDQFQLNIDRWNAQKTCRQANNLKLVLNPEANGVLFVGALDCNTTTCCAVPLVMRTTFEYYSGGTLIDVGGTAAVKCNENKRSGADTNFQDVSYNPLTRWPVMDHYFDYADPQSVSSFRNRIQFPLAQNGDSVKVTLSVHIPPIYDPVTGDPCPLPEDVAIPFSVANIWADHHPAPYPTRALIQVVAPVSQTAGCCS